MSQTFDSDGSYRRVGRAHAIEVIFEVADNHPNAGRALQVELALQHIGYRLALAMPSADCPEEWVDGMQDIEQALEAHRTLLRCKAET
jgi:hypothetical protein